MSDSKCRDKRKVWSLGVLLLLELTAAVLMLPWSFSSAAQENTTTSVFQLRPGVIVDLDRHLIYIMSGEGGIDAVDLARGTRAWSTKQAAKPLALAGRLLICQAEPPSGGNELQIVALDTEQLGKLVVTGTTKLPADVNVSIDETLTYSFVASARVSGAAAFISWAHSKRLIRGIPPGFPEVGEKVPLEHAVIAPSVASGTFRMDLSTGVMSPVKPEEVPVAVAAASRPPDLSPTERLAHIEGLQFRSANGRHVLNSQRIADDSVWEKYRWTIYDRGTGERVGEFRTHLSFAPFFIFDSQIIYETGPYVRRTEKGAVDEPLKIRAVDLRTGQELWTWQVRDTTFRGPFPP
jgi:hypothetical protein